ncbi:hypothetical protein H696_00144 [Fonticula alba]|uniref:Uncharacterized protein n=1 Tax=Fonticula alba TaxID=691883 RepID=A0A058ZF38_FONAL|nr:hypothetical protein H696_00144 [Fonticula alba]KCV72553.1 hypothetical protein H696_00144 [Fonticula alba]|eukprot:XP_009492254.1 hypothetical protein H696_00144 [Fonticula alba]
MAGMFPLPRLIVGLALGLLLLASQVAGTRIWLDRRFSLGNEVHLPTRVQSAAAIISEDPAIIEPGATLRLRLKSDPSDVSLYIAMMTTKQYMAPAKQEHVQKFEFKGDIDVTFALPTGGRLHVVLIVPPRSFQPLPPPPGQESAEGSSSPVPQYPDAIQLTGTLDYVNPNAGPFTVDNAPRRILSSIMLGLYCVLLVGVVLTLAGLLEHFGEGTPWQPLPQRPASDLVASGPVGTRGGGGSGALSRLNIAQSWKNNSVRWPTYFRLPWQHFEPAVDPRVLKELQLVALAVFACKLVQFILRTMYYELNYVTLMPDGDPLFLLSRPDTATAYPFAYLFYLQSFFGMLADALLVALLLVSALGWSLVYERVSEREVQLFGRMCNTCLGDGD